jgi:peptidoglycan L-alanyl-D-glutamate endopeptidase CwlK
MINSRIIYDLHPEVRELALKWLAECKAQGLDVIITSTLRDVDYQNSLYAQGRTKPGRVVTNARGGFSFHNFGVAFDFCVLKNGKPDWNDIKGFNKAADIGEALGLESLRNSKFPELAHLQFTNGKTLADFRLQYGIKKG